MNIALLYYLIIYKMIKLFQIAIPVRRESVPILMHVSTNSPKTPANKGKYMHYEMVQS